MRFHSPAPNAVALSRTAPCPALPGGPPELLRRVSVLLVGILVATLGMSVSPPAEAATSSLSGAVFQDSNRDGIRQSSEVPFAGPHRLHLFDRAGKAVAAVDTDGDGRFSFGAVADGTYEIGYSTSSWYGIRDSWVPTTTGNLWPRQKVVVSGNTTVDIGWRPLVTSTDTSAPITEHTGPSGLKVQSFNDAVSARHLHDHIVANFLVTGEAPMTTLRFGYGTTSQAQIVAGRDGRGVYTSFRATLWVSYRSWLNNADRTLAHEYGHAWAEYHTTMTQQDRTWTAYLEARGLAGDQRIGSSYAWLPTEIAAEDYRNLFAGAAARTPVGQINKDIPFAWDVTGFAEWLRTGFSAGTTAPTTEPTPTRATEPTPTKTTEPTTTEPTPTEPTPTTEPAPTTDPESSGEKCHPKRGCPGSPSSPTDAEKCHPKRGC